MLREAELRVFLYSQGTGLAQAGIITQTAALPPALTGTCCPSLSCTEDPYFFLLQIIHEQGSYSFLVCGMIFGGLAFTFYTFLLFFHRMHPKPSSGKKWQHLTLLQNERKSDLCLSLDQARSGPSKMQGNVYSAAASRSLFLL